MQYYHGQLKSSKPIETSQRIWCRGALPANHDSSNWVQAPYRRRERKNLPWDFAQGMLLAACYQKSSHRSQGLKLQYPLLLQNIWPCDCQRPNNLRFNGFQKSVQLPLRDSARPTNLRKRRKIWLDVYGWRPDPSALLYHLEVLHRARQSIPDRHSFPDRGKQNNQERRQSAWPAKLHHWNDQMLHAFKQRSASWISQQ